MKIRIGEVIAVNGIKITLRIFEDSSKDTLFYEGEKYKGISIREYISIQRGLLEAQLEHKPISDLLSEIKWIGNTAVNSFSITKQGVTTYFNSDGQGYQNIFGREVDNLTLEGLDSLDQLVIRANIQLIRDLIQGYVQFDFIQPLLKRIESSLSSLKKVIEVRAPDEDAKFLTIISLRKCNQEIKKVLPLLIAKHYYYQHKDTVGTPPDKTMHLIIDEAHNILSQQSSKGA
jgi:hypothetical protein